MKKEIELSYEEFVIGIAKGMVSIDIQKSGLKLLFEPFQVFIIRMLLFFAYLPAIAVIALCLFYNNWGLLLGYIGLFLAQLLSNITVIASKPVKQFIQLTFAMIPLVAIIVYYFGALNLISVVFLCLFIEYIILMSANTIIDVMAKSNLIKHENVYYFAIDNALIKTFRIS